MRYIILLLILYSSFSLRAQKATMISLSNEDYFDPEILGKENIMVWMDDNRILWYATLDKSNGNFLVNDGKEIVVDTSASLLQSWNAGEFMKDATGWKIIYTKESSTGLPQLYAAALNGSSFMPHQLTYGSSSNAGAIVSRNAAYQTGKLLFFSGYINNNANFVWADINSPNMKNNLGTFEKGFSHGDFLPGNQFGLVYAGKDTSGYYQLFIADSLNQKTQITSTPFHKQNPMALKATDYNNEIIIGCIKELPTGDSLIFYKENLGQWARITSLGVPAGASFSRFSSSEMFTYQNQSFISLQIEDTTGGGLQNAEIWIMSLNGHTALRVDEQNGNKLRTDPEYYVSQNKLFIYYNIFHNGIWELWVSEVDGQVITGLEEQEPHEDKLKIYPNPSTNLLYIEAPDDLRSVEILNLKGEKQRVKMLSNDTSMNVLDISELPSGIYLISIMGEKNRKVGKFIKE